MFIDILKEALRLMKKSMNLTQLIFLLFIVITIFAPVLAGVKINIKAIPMIVVFFIFLCSFFAGIFNAFKKALIYDTNPPKSNNPLDLPPLFFAEFFQGAGKYSKTFIFAGFLLLVILAVIITSYSYIVHHFIEIPQKFIDATAAGVLYDNAKTVEFFNSLTPQEITTIGKIGFLVLFDTFLFGYLTLLYPVAIVNEEKNFIVSFLISLKVLLKNIPVSLLIFFYFNILLTFISMLGAIFANNIILSVLCILFQCYLNVWYILSLFVYYEKAK